MLCTTDRRRRKIDSRRKSRLVNTFIQSTYQKGRGAQHISVMIGRENPHYIPLTAKWQLRGLEMEVAKEITYIL